MAQRDRVRSGFRSPLQRRTAGQVSLANVVAMGISAPKERMGVSAAKGVAIKSPRPRPPSGPPVSEAADIIAFNDIYHYFLKFSNGSLTAKRLRKCTLSRRVRH